jgi:hypothetical protein
MEAELLSCWLELLVLYCSESSASSHKLQSEFDMEWLTELRKLILPEPKPMPGALLLTAGGSALLAAAAWAPEPELPLLPPPPPPTLLLITVAISVDQSRRALELPLFPKLMLLCCWC